MNPYNLGLAVGSSRFPERYAYDRGLTVGATIATPGFLKQEANALYTEVYAMDAALGEVRASWGTVPDAQLDEHRQAMDAWWKAAWVPFITEFHKWWEDHGNTWGLVNAWNNAWGSVYDEAQDFRRRLAELRKSAEDVGYFFTIPGPTPPKENPGILESIGAAISAFFGKLLWVVVLVGGMVVVIKLIPAGGYHAMGAA